MPRKRRTSYPLPDDVGEWVFVAVQHGTILAMTAAWYAYQVRTEIASWFEGGWEEAREHGFRVRQARIVLEPK